ncbi:MAG: prepilin peptidase [Candidatus Aenigmarchaeota archaeon]|nr:prepilin peptidase [Candidatus Aenigmarchaeota archaeon]
MLLDQVIFGTALIGSGVASYYDLKTTEVPNWVFYAILIVGVPAVALNSLVNSSFDMFAVSGITGLSLLALGYGMYRAGQWGGADMTLLALIGFLMASVSLDFATQTAFPFGVSFLINLFLIGAVYMIGYSAVFALRSKDVMRAFGSDMRKNLVATALISLVMFVAFVALAAYLNGMFGGSMSLQDMLFLSLAPVAMTACFLLVYRFAKVVEGVGFKKKIPVSRLRVGDMLMDERKLVGIEEDQLRRIKRSGKKFVWIKEGVRFIPAFPMALLFTVLVGDAIFFARVFF